MGKLLSKGQILAAQDIQWEDVPVPEWPDEDGNPGVVRIQGMSGAQRAILNGTLMAVRGQDVSVKAEALAEAHERIVAMCLIDEEGKRLFTDKEFRKLAGKSAGVLSRLFNVANRLSGLDEGAVEQMAGNSGAPQSDASTSD